MFLETRGFQHGISVHGEIVEFHLKTYKKKTLSHWWYEKVVWLGLQLQHYPHKEQELCLGVWDTDPGLI